MSPNSRASLIRAATSRRRAVDQLLELGLEVGEPFGGEDDVLGHSVSVGSGSGREKTRCRAGQGTPGMGGRMSIEAPAAPDPACRRFLSLEVDGDLVTPGRLPAACRHRASTAAQQLAHAPRARRLRRAAAGACRATRVPAEPLDVPRIELAQVPARALGARGARRRARSPSRARRGSRRGSGSPVAQRRAAARTATGCRATRAPAARRPRPSARTRARRRSAVSQAARDQHRHRQLLDQLARRARSRACRCGAARRGGDGSQIPATRALARQPAGDRDPAADRRGAAPSGA